MRALLICLNGISHNLIGGYVSPLFLCPYVRLK